MSDKTVYKGFNKYNIAPYVSDKIGVYDKSNSLVGIVSISEFKPVYRDRLYRFGLLSDVHEQTSQVTENASDFRNALEVLNNKESVEFTCICGDVTQNGMVEGNTEIRQYANIVSEKSPSTPVFTTTGNHDCNGTEISSTKGIQDYLNAWKSFTNIDVSSFTLNWSPSNSSFYFIKALPSGAPDYFVFLAEQYNTLNANTYSEQDLTWLSSLLRLWGSSARVFIFTHMLFNGRAGAFKDRLESSNLLSGSQLTTLTNICDQYPKTIWFSGHSHWKWECQEKDTEDKTYTGMYCNIWHEKSGDHGWTVHCPSCASPTDSLKSSSDPTGWTRETNSNYATLSSEGAIVDVYENYIDIRGVAFKSYTSPSNFDTGYNLKYLPVATYRIPIPCSTGTSEKLEFNVTKTNATEIIYTNNKEIINFGSRYTTDIKGRYGYLVTGITATMGGQSISQYISRLGNIYTLDIPYVTDDIAINVAFVIDEDAGPVELGENTVKVLRNRNNSTKWKAPVTFTNENGDSYITIDITDVNEGWLFTNVNDENLQNDMASAMKLSCEEIHCYKVYLKNGAEFEEEITNLENIRYVGVFDSSQFKSRGNYSLSLPITTTFNLDVRYSCFDYNADIEPNYTEEPYSYHGIQFSSSSNFIQGNNSSWWPSNLALCQGSPISSTLFKFRVKIKNMSIATEAKPMEEVLDEEGE